MPVTIGMRLGPYEVLSAIGAGGMGEVYRARDTILNRDVALKVLSPAFSADAERVARFAREARLLASLNHPHIAAIYGVEETGAARALVLELVEGDTLEHRIHRGPLPLAEALRVAREIADALDAAHACGIIHRDLKPANIKLTRDGVVKVLDFGLAKGLVDDGSAPDLTETAPSDGTVPGVILGTAAYMSPEQARGQALDKRTDIWAFGCVLFEMLTGSPAFARPTFSDTVAAILAAEPDWTALPSGTPDAISRLLARCLQKDARRRLHDIADVGIEIEDAMVPSAPSIIAPRPRRTGVGILSLLLAIAALTFLWTARDKFRTAADPPARDARVVRLTDLPGLEESPAVSPDGKSVAFTASVKGKRQLFVQLLAGGSPLQLTSGPADHEHPRWSPDSSSILYFSPSASGDHQGSVWEIPALGGVARRVIDSVGGADVSLTNGHLALFRVANDRLQLLIAPTDGSRFTIVAEFAPDSHYLSPRWSPDGKSIAFQRGDSIRFDLFVTPATGGEPRQLTHDNSMMNGFAWLPDGTGLVFSSSRGGTMPYLPALGLWEVSLGDGTVRRVTSGEASYASPDIAANGGVLVSRMNLQTDIWKFPIDGLPTDNVRRAVRVTHQTGQVLTPTVSADDKEVAFLSDRGGHANLWVVNTETGVWRQITHERDPAVAIGLPVWSPQARSIAFVSSRGNQGLAFGVWLVDSEGSNLRNLANPGVGPAWSPDGRWVYYSTHTGIAGTDVVLKKISVDGGDAITVTTERLRNVIGSDGSTLYYLFEPPLTRGTREFEIRAAKPEGGPFRVVARIPASRVPIWQIVNPSLSPDGKWLAQALTDGFTTNIWALSTATGEWRQLTDFGDRPTFIARRVSWSSDGRAILAAVGEGDADIVLLDGLVSSRRPARLR